MSTITAACRILTEAIAAFDRPLLEKRMFHDVSTDKEDICNRPSGKGSPHEA